MTDKTKKGQSQDTQRWQTKKTMSSRKTQNDDRQKQTNMTVGRHITMTDKKQQWTVARYRTMIDKKQQWTVARYTTMTDKKQQWAVARHRTMTDKNNNNVNI
jgi:hypothetical protein